MLCQHPGICTVNSSSSRSLFLSVWMGRLKESPTDDVAHMRGPLSGFHQTHSLNVEDIHVCQELPNHILLFGAAHQV